MNNAHTGPEVLVVPKGLLGSLEDTPRLPLCEVQNRACQRCLPVGCSDVNIQKVRLHPFTCPAHSWTYKAVDTISQAITGPFQTISLPLSQSSLYSLQTIPHLQFVYFTDTSIFPANRNKSAFLLWLPIAFTHHLLPSAPAQITIVASSFQSPALTPIQLPKTKTFIFLMGRGDGVQSSTFCIPGLLSSQATFPEVGKSLCLAILFWSALKPFFGSRQSN